MRPSQGIMLGPLAAIIVIGLTILAYWLLADSDDDNSGGGLMEPALIPIPIKERNR